jgi:flagellar hook capping protein FlgD/glycosyl hydrolase family 32
MRRLATILLAACCVVPCAARPAAAADATIHPLTDTDPPSIRRVFRNHPPGIYVIEVTGRSLLAVAGVRVAAPDASWSLGLNIVDLTDTTLTATASVAALMPASVLELETAKGAQAWAAVPADVPLPPVADITVASYLDSSTYIRPKDFAFFYDGLGHFHVFYTRSNGRLDCTQYALNEKSFAHVWSSDLVHWSRPDTTSFRVGPPGQWDSNHVWAPTIVQQGPVYYMIYTGVDAFDNQTIGYATATDLNTPSIAWERQSTPMFSAGNAAWASNSSPQQLRDPFVMPDPFQPGRYLMYYASVMSKVSQDTMCVGVAQSAPGTPTQWSDLNPLYMTDFYHTLRVKTESPHAFLHVNRGHVPADSSWYLLFTSESSPASIRLLRNNHNPADPSEAYDPDHWTEVNSLFGYLNNDTRVANWYGSEHVQFYGREYLAGFSGTTRADCTVGDWTRCRIWFAQLRWEPGALGTPDHFWIAGPITGVDDVEGGEHGVDGIELRLVRGTLGRSPMEFAITLPAAMPARLVVYDVAGRSVRTLIAGGLPAGSTAVAWDGRDQRGARIASGMYFVRLSCGAGNRVVRAPLLR